ncbi:hypothetical protein TOPH_07725 [Tolypocladium ophioglossoides CBS 100239]|uniref:Mcm2 3 5 family protein n=1 Tax=Tolypocladium ophioglossoides (strain CBS 100239) TaxID=1163406 RepID=A0A0L0N0V9_TOLOC|nr:hypothetical protein TOPH_07725 [Tolypocladium ophioglossoides CBS 100239]
MASKPLGPVAESDEIVISPASDGSPLYKAFSPSAVKRSAYHRVPSNGAPAADMMGLGDDAVPSPADGLGIFPRRASVPPRVPVGSRPAAAAAATPPGTPPQAAVSPHHGLVISSPMSSAAASPRTGLLSGSRSSAMFERVKGAFAPKRSPTPKRKASFQTTAPTEPLSGSLSPDERKGVSSNETSTAISDVECEAGDDLIDDDMFKKKFAEAPTYCWSKKDIVKKRNTWLSFIIFALSVYSTVMSGIWMVVSFVQPRWGHTISSHDGLLLPSTATLITALLAKTIELSFVTVFIACIGQVLTRRAIARRSSGMTLAEMTMRNWVFQPGSLITHWESVPYAAITLLGALSLTASIVAMFYTTASDAMVAPKLMFGSWETVPMQGHIRASYANAGYVKKICPSLLEARDPFSAGESCMNVQFSSQSYRNLLAFMEDWTNIYRNGSTTNASGLGGRPNGTTLLYDNTTMTSSWIEMQYSNVTAHHETYGRIINNVTLAMPHPGVYAAARDRINHILQPDELGNVGEYAIKAAVVSPSLNVMCVNMSPTELAPLIYTEWPGSDKKNATAWQQDIPNWADETGKENYLNRTVVDDIFQWGPQYVPNKYVRRPPIFQRYPSDFNIVTNSSIAEQADAFYILGKDPTLANYTLCEMRSWVSPACSTHFNISGTAGASMQAHCEDGNDLDAYHLSREREPSFDRDWPRPSWDWKWIASQWGLSMNLNGGATDSNASNARILTQLALKQPKLPSYLPSLAEALAVYGSSMLVIGSIGTPFRHYWGYDIPNNIIPDVPGPLDQFYASVITQQYTSGHTNSWQSMFYVVLMLTFIINICCLVYLCLRAEQVTDFTEPQNLFALAINSPPSAQLKGSCGAGPVDRDLVVPWRVEYVKDSNHYFFEEANEKPWRGKYSGQGVSTTRDYGDVKGASYKRLSSGKAWL